MEKIKLLTLLSLVFVCFLKGQIIERKEKGRINPIDYLKTEVYKSIILSEEFKSNKKCHIVGINTTSLKMDYSIGSPLGDYFYNVQVVKDSISVKKLREELSEKYWVFEDSKKFLGVEYDMSYISSLERSDSLYAPKYLAYDYDVCNNSIDVIKIYDPLDKWIKFYVNYYSNHPIKISKEFQNYEVVIPVKYELLSKGHMFLEKEKYYLFKIKIGYNDKGKLEVIKEIINGIKEERDII